MHQSRNTSAAPGTRVERFDTIVVGAGQTGLAVGYHLAERDVDFAIVGAERRIGDSWRQRWDSLRVFTSARYNGLPGMPFPAPPRHFPDKDEVADYLERYAERFDLPVRLDTRVDSLGWDGERYVLRAGGSTLEANNVVVATGAFQKARIPKIAARLSPEIHQLHSSQYRNPWALPDGSVLVVGVGNSGAQIALELARFRKVWLAGRETGHLPRRLLGRDVFDWVWPVMARTAPDSWLGRRMRERMRHGDLLIGIPSSAFTRAGVVRVGRLTEERGGQPVCGGAVIEPSVIIWCTGYESDQAWIDLSIRDAAGCVRHRRGIALDAPGLYFVGLRFQRRLTSSLIGGVGADAEYIAEQVARRSEVVETV